MSEIAEDDFGECIRLKTLRRLWLGAISFGIVEEDVIIGNITIVYRFCYLCKRPCFIPSVGFESTYESNCRPPHQCPARLQFACTSQLQWVLRIHAILRFIVSYNPWAKTYDGFWMYSKLLKQITAENNARINFKCLWRRNLLTKMFGYRSYFLFITLRKLFQVPAIVVTSMFRSAMPFYMMKIASMFLPEI